MPTTAAAVCFGCARLELTQLLGLCVCVCVGGGAAGFRREMLSCMGILYDYVQRMPLSGKCIIRGAAADELGALGCLCPLVESDLRRQPARNSAGEHLVFSTDAAGSGGLGACATTASASEWSLLHRLTEPKGCYANFDWDAPLRQPLT